MTASGGVHAMDEDDERVSVEISLAENVYVTIKTSVKGYDDVLKDARDIAKELNEYLEKRHKASEKNSDKLYG
jgi:hypothetical protein